MASRKQHTVRLKQLGWCTSLFLTLCTWACNGPAAPLDADTRLRIDSIANARIARLQVEHDSLCKVAHQTRLTPLIDSIKKIRLREIEQQLKTIPK